MILLLVLYAHFLSSVTSAPVPAPDQQHEYVSWNGEPQTRETFSLLTNCLITLSLSIWTAVHLNITVEPLPHEKLSFLSRLSSRPAVRRLKWMLMGLLAPELVVYTAWQQWTSARVMARKMRRVLQKQAEEDGRATTEYEWTMVHSFYAGMGGFVVDFSGSSFSHNHTIKPELKAYIPGDCCQLTLTAQGVLFLASSGYRLPLISKNTILDHSKADGIAKILVCLQAGYMIVQCASRLASKLPISLLEVNTLGHVFCALVMYSFWLHKPQDIHAATHISDDPFRPACAFMCMASKLGTSTGIFRCDFDELKWQTPPHSEEDICMLLRTGSDLSPHKIVLPLSPDPPAGTVIRIRDNETLKGTKLAPYGKELVHLDECGVTRWRLSSSFICANHSSHMLETFRYFRDRREREWLRVRPQCLYFVLEVPNWPDGAGYLSKSIYTTWAAVALAVGLYGGLHVLARNSHFPSSIEKTMWCASSIFIAGSGAVALISIILDRLPSRGREPFTGILYTKLLHFSRRRFCGLPILYAPKYFCFIPGCVIVGLAYVIARVFIVVEAFISLRDLPIKVYQTPDWTQLIPHL